MPHQHCAASPSSALLPALGPAIPAAAALAAAAPSLLAYNLSPSPTFLNQALAVALWSGFVMLAPAGPGRGPWPVWAALAGVALGVAGSWAVALPASLALSALAMLAAAALLLAAGAGMRRRADAPALFAAFCAAWVIAGALNMVVAVVQVFWPGLADGHWIAASGLVGRAVGNLRQPNHLSSLLLWAVIAALALAQLGRLGPRAAGALVALFVFGVVLTASRTGLVSVALLALWGLADRRLRRPVRLLALAAPLFYALAWWAMAQWAALSQHTFGGSARLAESDISSSRFAIWSDTLALIARQPWLGTGFGEFNLAWTLTPFPGRPTAFFDHTHNLPLQLAVELGLPLAALVMALLLWALWAGWRRSARTPGALGDAQRAAMMMVWMIGLHSLLEYPLWYAYFLLPAAWAWGFALAGGAAGGAGPAGRVEPQGDEADTADTADVAAEAAEAAPAARVLRALAAALVLCAALSVPDYLRVARIFAAPEGAPPLAERIESGRRSVLFAHHADYAAVTSGAAAQDRARSFASTVHYLLDTRLMIAWAEWHHAQGRDEMARHLAARLREFHKADAESFFAPCADPARPQPDFPCAPPAHAPGWREFLGR